MAYLAVCQCGPVCLLTLVNIILSCHCQHVILLPFQVGKLGGQFELVGGFHLLPVILALVTLVDAIVKDLGASCVCGWLPLDVGTRLVDLSDLYTRGWTWGS